MEELNFDGRSSRLARLVSPKTKEGKKDWSTREILLCCQKNGWRESGKLTCHPRFQTSDITRHHHIAASQPAQPAQRPSNRLGLGWLLGSWLSCLFVLGCWLLAGRCVVGTLELGPAINQSLGRIPSSLILLSHFTSHDRRLLTLSS